eukprot:jgi/Orpsp1_1/1183964/evm.model.c7180000087405.1
MIKRISTYLYLISFLLKVFSIKNAEFESIPGSTGYGGAIIRWEAEPDIVYKISKSIDGNKFDSVGVNFEEIENIKVLQIYPTSGTKDLNQWMNQKNENFGKGLITVDRCSIADYNKNPNNYLKSGDDWKYDVIFFGTWDAQGASGLNDNSKNLNENAVLATEAYIKTGRGCIMGHDTIGYIWGDEGFGKLREYFGIVTGRWRYTENKHKKSDYETSWGHKSTKVQIKKNGLFTRYPWDIGDVGTVLTVPLTHTCANAALKENVWLELINTSWNGEKYQKGINDDTLINRGYNPYYYLSTKNNCAMIQTGHSNGSSTADERKILANLIFFLVQLQTKSPLIDNSAMDYAAPYEPTIEYRKDPDNDKEYLTVSDTDDGTLYYYKIEEFDKNDTSIQLNNNATVTAGRVTIGIKEYRYIIDEKENTEITINNISTAQSVEVNNNSSNNKIDNMINIDVDKEDKVKYLHIVAVDHSGNISPTSHHEIPEKIIIETNNTTEKDNTDDNATLDEPNHIPLNITSFESLPGKTGRGAALINWTTNDDKIYMVSKSTDGLDYQSVGVNYDDIADKIKVLQIFPTDNAKSQLKEWMIDNKFGNELMDIDSYSIDDFNANPDSLLKSNDDWKYDVIFFGTWENQNNNNLNEDAIKAVEAFINSGRGCIMGHDTIGYTWGDDGFNKLREYFNIRIGRWNYENTPNINYQTSWGYYSTTIQITKNGLFTTYPHNIGNIGMELSVPQTRTCANAAFTENVWLRLVNATNGQDYSNGISKEIIEDDGYDQLYYLSTYNNCAMIQLGHTCNSDYPNQATEEEQKILANLIFSLVQLHTSSSLIDNSAMDYEAPNAPTIVSTELKLNQISVNVTSTDNGTHYYYKVIEYNKDKYDIRQPESTAIKDGIIISGIKGYRYVIDDKPDTGITIEDGDFTDNDNITVDKDYNVQYLHIAAVDGNDNISSTIHYKISAKVKILSLESIPSDSGKGAAKLTWSSSDDDNKIYKVYKSTDGIEYQLVGENNQDITIKSPFIDNTSIDNEPPNTPNISLDVNDCDNIKFNLSTITHIGTKYYYKVEEFDKSDPVNLTSYDSISGFITTGIKGYRYIIDDKPDTNVTIEDGVFTDNDNIAVSKTFNVQYIHIVAVGENDNISSTVHYRIHTKAY